MLFPTRTALAALAACSLALTACGGDDEDTTPPDTPSSEAATDAPTDAPAIEFEPGDNVVDAVTDAMGEDGQALDDALAAMSPEARFGPVASQLDPEPTVEVDGSDIRLVFDGSSVGNATFDCIVGGAFLEPGETLTMVYPDGEQEC
jgi:hypothetical protein